MTLDSFMLHPPHHVKTRQHSLSTCSLGFSQCQMNSKVKRFLKKMVALYF